MKPLNIEQLVRPNIRDLQPYEAARHLINEPAILLDANENPFPSTANRYPDPWQKKLKARIGAIKEISPDNIFIGNGSDEIIDLLLRIFCTPGKDKIIITPPTYGMYEVSAGINDTGVIKVSLEDDFTLNPDDVLKATTAETKLIFLCSPNNPTGNILKKESVEAIIDNFNGLVIVDEAYIDFASSESWLSRLEKYGNLVVMQTLSKAYGMAGLRIGLAFASQYIISLLNKVKPPYNISILSQNAALEALEDTSQVCRETDFILNERERMKILLRKLKIVENIYPSEANFLLVKMKNADDIFHHLKTEGIIVRSRSKVAKCEGCLRITIGTGEENNALIEKLKEYENNTRSVY